MQHELTPEQKSKIKKQEERRGRNRRQREAEYRRRIERLRRQIEEARKRRQRFLLLFLTAVLAMQESFLAAFQRSFAYRPDHGLEPENWTPDPNGDYAPRLGHDDYIDGYSRDQWDRMTTKRGIHISRKDELKAEWMADPERELFPTRYKDWGYRPFLGEIMNDLSEPRYQPDALKGLKLRSPPETHQYLDEVYAINPLDLLHCRSELSADIIHNIKSRAVLWAECKRREAEELRKAKKDKKPDDDEKKFDL
ncbi:MULTISPECIES: hypothetical protein [unclassified Agrobacterium]|uniref:hypothetical protein n=1 Tax=unclassified Agrobacterium TaxID=2632611 RepID=UPI000B68994F|nr:MULTISPECIES: hypothetical protein [unclassified Agrobacterium]SNB71855.1 hypothetical protein SAMN05661103_3504 [Agrobacterium sp. 719_389]